MTLRRGSAVRAALFAGGAVGVALLPRLISDFRALQLALVAIYVVALLGLNVLTGYSGQISLGHGAFMALGAYTTAILVSDQGLKLAGHTFSSDLKDLWTIPLGGLVAGAAGFLFGVPALRLTGLYLALATFGVGIALPAVARRFEELTGGSTGINLFGLPGHTGGVTGVDVLGRQLTFNDYIYYLCWGVAGVLFVAAWLLLRGRTGRALRALRDSEAAAASSGVSPATYKTLAFAVSAFYAGVAGSLYAIHTTFVNPDVFPLTLSIFLVVGVVVGGLGSLDAVVVGALFVVYLPRLAEWLAGRGVLPGEAREFFASPGAPSVVFGAALILVMFLLPTGAAGLLRKLYTPLTTRRYSRSQ